MDKQHSQALLARACLPSFPPLRKKGRQRPDDSPRSHPPIPLPGLAQPSPAPLLWANDHLFMRGREGSRLPFPPQALLWFACSRIDRNPIFREWSWRREQHPSRRQTDQSHSPASGGFTCSLPVPWGMARSFLHPLLGGFESCLQLFTPTKTEYAKQ